MTERKRLTPTQTHDLNWMVKRVCVDTLPEYQPMSDTLLFRDNFKNAADNFREQHRQDKGNIKLYDFEIEWIRVGFKQHLKDLDEKILEDQENIIESVTYDSNNFKYPTPL